MTNFKGYTGTGRPSSLPAWRRLMSLSESDGFAEYTATWLIAVSLDLISKALC
jgi:hypothetical protein